MKAQVSESHFTNRLSPSQQEELACVLDQYLVGIEQGSAPNFERHLQRASRAGTRYSAPTSKV